MALTKEKVTEEEGYKRGETRQLYNQEEEKKKDGAGEGDQGDEIMMEVEKRTCNIHCK